MAKKILKIFAFFFLGMAGGIFSQYINLPYSFEKILFLKSQNKERPIYVVEKKEVIIEENTALKDAIEKVEKAMVGIKTETKKGKIIEGSGLVITSDGFIVAPSQLFQPEDKTTLFLEGEKIPYQILKKDVKENLILLKIERTNLATVDFASFEKIKLGERVFLVGAIFEKEKMEKTVNEGIVKKFNTEIIETNIFEKENIIGSPLFNIFGQCLGINFLKENRVITIPISKIKEFSGL